MRVWVTELRYDGMIWLVEAASTKFEEAQEIVRFFQLHSVAGLPADPNLDYNGIWLENVTAFWGLYISSCVPWPNLGKLQL